MSYIHSALHRLQVGQFENTWVMRYFIVPAIAW